MMWKSNWNETKQRFIDWWNHEGLLVGMWNAPDIGYCIHEQVAPPLAPDSIDERYCHAAFRAAQNHYNLSRQIFPADTLPIANTDLGPGSLALLCGSSPGFSEETVWFWPCWEHVAEPEKLPPLRFDEQHPWWQTTIKIIEACAQKAAGKYLVGCPDLIENIDILASLRAAQTLLVDMIERPEWIEQKVWEINQVWFEAYQRIYNVIKLEDGSAAFVAFAIWGPGKTAKLQCDASAMFSPRMFQRFVVPALTAQCEWLDYSMYHLDGTQAICHLEALLAIDALDAIEWTPQAGIEGGGHPRWYDLYRRILNAGKSVQIVGVEQHEILPLFDAIGDKGVYILTSFANEHEAEHLLEHIAHWSSR